MGDEPAQRRVATQVANAADVALIGGLLARALADRRDSRRPGRA
ncbi:MAG TPA: hypothetical protein VFV01_15565 [Spirillospora sp.]|nr:hypothetical protein [Spirillospora sp.]